MNNSRLLLFWIPLVSVLLMVIWGFIGWFWLGIENAGVLGDSMSPIASLITAFALGAALYSLDVQRKALEVHKNKETEEEDKLESLINKLERLDAQHHQDPKQQLSMHCPWCEILDKVKK